MRRLMAVTAITFCFAIGSPVQADPICVDDIPGHEEIQECADPAAIALPEELRICATNPCTLAPGGQSGSVPLGSGGSIPIIVPLGNGTYAYCPPQPGIGCYGAEANGSVGFTVRYPGGNVTYKVPYFWLQLDGRNGLVLYGPTFDPGGANYNPSGATGADPTSPQTCVIAGSPTPNC